MNILRVQPHDPFTIESDRGCGQLFRDSPTCNRAQPPAFSRATACFDWRSRWLSLRHRRPRAAISREPLSPVPVPETELTTAYHLFSLTFRSEFCRAWWNIAGLDRHRHSLMFSIQSFSVNFNIIY
ncbi:hypothetical protein ACFE04_004286 [Oxalis oulophora]